MHYPFFNYLNRLAPGKSFRSRQSAGSPGKNFWIFAGGDQMRPSGRRRATDSVEGVRAQNM